MSWLLANPYQRIPQASQTMNNAAAKLFLINNWNRCANRMSNESTTLAPLSKLLCEGIIVMSPSRAQINRKLRLNGEFYHTLIRFWLREKQQPSQNPSKFSRANFTDIF